MKIYTTSIYNGSRKGFSIKGLYETLDLAIEAMENDPIPEFRYKSIHCEDLNAPVKHYRKNCVWKNFEWEDFEKMLNEVLMELNSSRTGRIFTS